METKYIKKYIKPVIRLGGSKYKLLSHILRVLDLKETDKFLDMFGGTGIVGVNVKHIYGIKTIINDFDNILPITNHNAIKNILSFEGKGKNFTRQSVDKLIMRIKNGYWEKLETYNDVLKDCTIVHNDVLKEWNKIMALISFWDINKLYADPPYYGINGIYKSDFNHIEHESLRNFLEALIITQKVDKIVVSYNDCPEVRELYKDWNIEEIKHQNRMGTALKKRWVNELLISKGKE